MQVGGKSYPVEIIRKVTAGPKTTKLATVSYITTDEGRDITRVCLESILRFTTGHYELWVVDNGSPIKYTNWLRNLPNVNVVLNNTNPISGHRLPLWQRLGLYNKSNNQQLTDGSMANAVGLELAAQAIDPRTERLFIMHNDVLACREGWLDYLLTKFNEKVRGAAMFSDPIRINAMHASGTLFDFSLFKSLGISFLPDIPQYDVADHITLRLREEGYQYFVCPNTVIQPELHGIVPAESPTRHIQADRAFDDQGQVIYMHLGRGTVKSAGTYTKPRKTYPREWVDFAEKNLLA